MAMSFASCKDADDGKADSVWLNGTIYTVDDEFSVASAIAVVGDKLVYVGDDEGVQDYIEHNRYRFGRQVCPAGTDRQSFAYGNDW